MSSGFRLEIFKVVKNDYRVIRKEGLLRKTFKTRLRETCLAWECEDKGKCFRFGRRAGVKTRKIINSECRVNIT